MSFIIAAVLLVVFVLLLISWPLWRSGKPGNRVVTDGSDIAEFELRRDIDAGVLDPDQFATAKADMLAAEPEHFAAEHSRRGGLSRHWPHFVVFLVIPIAVGAIYWHVGNWRAGIEGVRPATAHRAQVMLHELIAYLKHHPEDSQGWEALGRADEAMGHYPKAIVAFRHAVKTHTGAPNAELLAEYGESMILSDPKHLTGQERTIFNRVLKLQPDNPRGLWYGGLLAAANGHRDRTIALWTRLLSQQIPTPMRRLVRHEFTRLGVAPPPQQQPKTTSGKIPVSGPDKLQVVINLSPKLRKDLRPGQHLLVFARLPGDRGPPIAVKRLSDHEFPRTVTLTSQDAMMPSMSLSRAKGKLDVVARVSDTGDAAPHAGDLVGRQTVDFEGGTTRVHVIINHVLRH